VGCIDCYYPKNSLVSFSYRLTIIDFDYCRECKQGGSDYINMLSAPIFN
jgi:hypothetical protein